MCSYLPLQLLAPGKDVFASVLRVLWPASWSFFDIVEGHRPSSSDDIVYFVWSWPLLGMGLMVGLFRIFNSMQKKQYFKQV